jgi:arabinofuranan 3-O-arabinosyltransferase
VSGLQLQSDQFLAGSRPTRVRVRFDSGDLLSAPVDDEGYVRFPARSTRTLDIGLERSTGVTNIDSATGLRRTLPVGVSEVRVLGADDLRSRVDLTQQTGAPCGFGPTVVVDGTPILTRVVGTLQDIVQRNPLRWVACGSDPTTDATAGTVGLAAGAHSVAAGVTNEFEPSQMSFTAAATDGSTSAGSTSAGSTPAVAASLVRPDPARMRIRVGERAQESVLTVAQNFNEGWAARDGKGTVLASIRVDGWKQGWVLPPGAATVVTARFAPDGPYRGGLVLGLVTLLCAAASVPLSRRRRPGLAEHEAPGEARVPAVVLVAGAAVALATMSGWAGVAAGVVVGVLLLLQRWVSPRLRFPVVVLALGLAAGVLAALQPWGRGGAGLHSTAVQCLVLVAFGLAVAAAFRDEPAVGTSSGGGETSKRRSRRPRRMMGRSIRR